MAADLIAFRRDLQEILTDPFERPFVCDGNPRSASTFIIGCNPATTMKSNFWEFWSDEGGMDRAKFLKDYQAQRKIGGVRARIERIVGKLPKSSCLETNVFAYPTRRASQLFEDKRNNRTLQFLLELIKPSTIFLHSSEPIKYFSKLAGKHFENMVPEFVTVNGFRVALLARYGPLYTLGYEGADLIGEKLKELQ